MSEPVLEKSKSTLSKGTSSAPQTWAEYKERLKVFGWQNGTSYKWYCFNLNLSRKRRLKRGGLEIFYCFLSRLCLALLFLLFARKCMQSVKETHSNATIRSIRAERSRVVETERWKSDRHFNRIWPLPCVLPLYKEREKNVKESANHQKLSFKRQEHEGWIFHRIGRNRSVRGTILR